MKVFYFYMQIESDSADVGLNNLLKPIIAFLCVFIVV